MNKTFTVDGDEALERHLSEVCTLVSAGVQQIVPRRRIEGIVLAGGYGRGEGGVLRAAGTDKPYNDLEFFVLIRGATLLNDHLYRRALHRLGQALSVQAGIEVEFKILSLIQLRQSAPSMFYYDLVMGHHWLLGDETLFQGCEHHRDASAIPLHEATRLLFNRCSGLLYAKERLQRVEFTDADADFVSRNIAKAQLALGDVWLAMHGAYHWSCQERLLRLQHLPHDWARKLCPHHEAGVAFKLHPSAASTDQKQNLCAAHAEVAQLAKALWLHLEGRRMRHRFRSVRDYALTRRHLCPEHPAWKNSLSNLRSLGWRSMLSEFRMRYPRERLLRALSLLLWGQTTEEEEVIIATCLQCPPRRFTAAVQAYEKLWHHFN